MKNTLLKTLGLLAVSLTPTALRAQGLVPCENDCDYNDLIDLVSNVVNFMFSIVGLIATIVLVVVGISFMMNGNNPGARAKAKKMLGRFFLGLILIMCAWLIIATVLRLLGVDDAYSLLQL